MIFGLAFRYEGIALAVNSEGTSDKPFFMRNPNMPSLSDGSNPRAPTPQFINLGMHGNHIVISLQG